MLVEVSTEPLGVDLWSILERCLQLGGMDEARLVVGAVHSYMMVYLAAAR